MEKRSSACRNGCGQAHDLAPFDWCGYSLCYLPSAVHTPVINRGSTLPAAEAIVSWVFQSEGVRSLKDELLTGLSWEILYNAVNKSIARVQVRPDMEHRCAI